MINTSVESNDKQIETISIRPDSGVYATYQRLSYRPWYAVAEFVDNSTQNYYDNKEALQNVYNMEGEGKKLKIVINYEEETNTLVIYDNANGMELEELRRAVALNKPPPNINGRCEFGMGLKTAACWFGKKWSIKTTKLGSSRELHVTVQVPDLVINKTEEVIVVENEADERAHYTEIKIEQLYRPLKGRTLGRIKEQLGSIYREDLRSSEVEILWNGDHVTFHEPTFLRESYGNGQETLWKKNISFVVRATSIREPLGVSGWIGIMIPGNQHLAGFALLRRGRVIIGGPGEGYKPTDVFGQANSFSSQRLIGEFHMDNWPVTQAKDAFDWSGDLEELFIEKMKETCKEYVDKAEKHRERILGVSKGEMTMASESIMKVLSDKKFEEAIQEEINFPTPQKSPTQVKDDAKKIEAVSSGPIEFTLDFVSSKWVFRLHWQDQISDANWMGVDYPQDNEINIYLNMANSFFSEFLENSTNLNVLQKFVIALALAEKLARVSAVNDCVSPGEVRTKMNAILRKASELERRNGH